MMIYFGFGGFWISMGIYMLVTQSYGKCIIGTHILPNFRTYYVDYNFGNLANALLIYWFIHTEVSIMFMQKLKGMAPRFTHPTEC